MKKQLLLFAMILLPLVASANDIEVKNAQGVTIYYNYINNGTELEVTFRGISPNTYNEYTGIVVIPEEVTYMNRTHKVTSIGDFAFYGCSGLSSISIPSSVTSIGSGVFYGCSDLTSIVVEAGNTKYDSRDNCNAIIETASNTLFYGCKNTNIPDNISSIGSGAFDGCSGLSSISIPSSVTSIGSGVFYGCSDLTSIVVEAGNTKYDSRDNCNAIIETASNTLFYGCKNTNIPDGISIIGHGAFDGCSGLTSVTIPNSVVSIGVNAFAFCSSLTSITIPNSVTRIGGSAFFGCSGLTSISISDNLTSIEYGTFCNCSSLTSVIIPNGVTSIGESAFDNCSGLTSIVIPNTVTSIGKYAFRFTRVTSIVIPNSVTSIGSDAFFQCKDLTSVTIGNSVKSIGENAFKFCRLQNVVAKNSKTTINQNGSFDQSTLNHAILYIPAGQRWDYVYGGSWYKFLNMKEMAAETSEISEQNAYLLMNAKSFKYMVYDEVNDEVRTINSFYDVDENVASNNWQFVNIDGQKCLYNIKAKKYASISQEGKIQLQASPIPLNMSNGSDGIIVDGNEEIQYNFVVNDKMAIDQNPTGIDMVRDSEFKGNTYYDLNGRKLSEKPSHKGIYINNGKKLVVK